jgi:hypothetical protein
MGGPPKNFNLTFFCDARAHNMRALLLSLAVVAAASATTTSSVRSIPPPPAIAAAFLADGFEATSALAYGGGIGVAALALNATINNNATMRKPAYYVSGSGYEMGYLLGQLAEPAVSDMTGVYLEHIVPSLLDERLDILLQNSSFAPIYDDLITLLEDLLVNDGIESFTASLTAGAYDTRLVDEMRGLSDGARAANPFSTATFSNIAVLNTGYDFLLALIFDGQILSLLGDKARRAGLSPEKLESLRNLPLSAFRPPVFCNAFTATGAALAGGSGSIMARDFMFSLGEVFQYHVSPIIYSPTDGRTPLVGVAAPGFVGSMVAMNSDGFMMGVDVLQAAVANTTVVGVNSLLLVRSTSHAASTTAAATAFVRASLRGVPWIYPMSDAGGDGRILETLPAELCAAAGGVDGGAWPDFRSLVDDAALQALIPSGAAVQGMVGAVDYAAGVWVRNTTAKLAPERELIPALNSALWQHAGLPPPNASAWSPTGFVWANWTQETVDFSALKQAWFSPERVQRNDIVLATNFAVVPAVRVAAMNFWSGLDGMARPSSGTTGSCSRFWPPSEAAPPGRRPCPSRRPSTPSRSSPASRTTTARRWRGSSRSGTWSPVY